MTTHMLCFFFFSSRRRHTRCGRDWSSDVCSSDLGTLGSGNHFVELARDERGRVWILLHSGSRGGGNKLATIHTRLAKQIARREGLALEDDELSWFEGGTEEFDHYLRDLGWSQLYALENRRLMLGATHDLLVEVLGRWVDGGVNVN